jgi:intracellular multiplication protein IcmE
MASEQDAGRATRLTLGLIGGLLVIVVGGGYALWSWLSTPPAQPSRISLDRVSGSARSGGTESPAYRQLLEQYNRDGVAAAKQQNGSFIASMPLELEPVKPAIPKSAPPKKGADNVSERRGNGDGNANAADTSKQDERRQQNLDKFLARLIPDESKTADPGLQPARLLGAASGSGGLNGGQAGTGDNSYQEWSASLGGQMRRVASAANGWNGTASGPGASAVPIEVIPPYWRGPGEIDVGVDSDNSTTPVLGRINTGKYAGAVLKASDGAKLTGDGVVIHFTEMAYKGLNYKVDAYALQEDNLLANVATDVNHRYMSRIVLPALLSGIGGVGELYSQANTQLISNGFTSQVVRPALPDSTAVMGAIAGGAAGQAAKVLSADAARLPATQVTVTAGQVVAIQFMRGVYSGDAIAPGQGGDAVKASIPLQSTNSAALPTGTADQWRAAARTQIQTQQQLQELNR